MSLNLSCVWELVKYLYIDRVNKYPKLDFFREIEIFNQTGRFER